MSIFDSSNEMIKAPIYWTTVIENEFKPMLFKWFKDEFCGEFKIQNALYRGDIKFIQKILTDSIKDYNTDEEMLYHYQAQLYYLIAVKPRSRIEYTVEFRIKHRDEKISEWGEMMNILNAEIKVMFTKREGNFIFVNEI